MAPVAERAPALDPPRPAPAGPRPVPNGAPVHPLMRMQRTVGNRAVELALGARGGPAPPAPPALQRVCACGGGAGGPCGCHDHEDPEPRAPIQTQLVLNEPGDEYEQEADRTADLVMRAPAHPAGAAPDPPAPPALPAIRPYVQRQSSGAAADAGGVGGVGGGPSLEARLSESAAGGRPMEPGIRAPLEARFGVDFSGVRIHHGPAAAALSDDLDALAFTHGRDVYFASGMYSPGTPSGQRLLAHELTHVVQQGGGTGAVARRPRPPVIQRAAPQVEKKLYYFSGLSGKAVHERVESLLLEDKANPSLVVEAPIPGGTTKKVFDRTTKDEFDIVGRADLYTSSDAQAAPGVRGFVDDDEKAKAPDLRARQYRDMPRSGATQAAGGKVKWKPDASAGGKKITGRFPATFGVADLKPLWVTKAGEGLAQISHYIEGFHSFVEQAKADGALTQAGDTRGSPLTTLHIPDGLNYWKLDDEEKKGGKPGPGNFIAGDRRYWIAAGHHDGLYFYFTLKHPAPSKAAREKAEATLASFIPIKKQLVFPEAGPGSALNLKRRPPRRAAAAPRPVVQRKRTIRDKAYWDAEGAKWETKRAEWDTTKAKPYLKTQEAKHVEERAGAEKHLKGGSGSTFAPAAKAHNTVELWSGETGKRLGQLRFFLGHTFDKIVAFYEKIRARFKGFHDKVGKISGTGLSVGWKQKLVGAILKALKLAFRKLLETLFAMFADCLQGILDKVVRKFTEDISKELQEHLDELHKRFEDFKEKFEQEFESRFGSWDKFIADISDVAKWGQIAADLITLIRLGVQAISCLSPPALGCLWGLVAQLAIEAALDFVMGHPWFDKNIVAPSVRNVIERFAGPAYQKLLDGTLRLAKLDEFARDVRECHRHEDDPTGLVESAVKEVPISGLSDADVIRKRDEWYKQNQPEVRGALKKWMGEQGMGAPTAEQIERLEKALDRAKPTKSELDGATSKGGTIEDLIEKLEKRAAGGGTPAKPGAQVADPRVEAEITKAQEKVRERFGWPDQKKANEAWEALDAARDEIAGSSGDAVTGGEIIELADAAARKGLGGDEVRQAVKDAPPKSGGKRSIDDVRKEIERKGAEKSGPKPGAKPGPQIPPITIKKRIDISDLGGPKPDTGPKLPAGLGPKEFTPPGPPGSSPTVLPGVGGSF